MVRPKTAEAACKSPRPTWWALRTVPPTESMTPMPKKMLKAGLTILMAARAWAPT